MDLIQKQRTKENEAKIILETEESDIYISFSQKKIIATISNVNNFKITIHFSSDSEDHGKEKTESLENEDKCFLTLYVESVSSPLESQVGHVTYFWIMEHQQT